MRASEANHLSAFVIFVDADARLKRAIQQRDLPTFARIYNGPDYRKNNQDTRMRDNCNPLTAIMNDVMAKSCRADRGDAMMKTATATLMLMLAMPALFSPCLAAETISLMALDGSEAIGNPERKAAEDGLTSVETYPDRSFSVALAGRPLATLVLARAESTAMPNSSICFLAFATDGASSSPAILRTIGSGNFENTTCDGVEAVATATKGEETKLIVLFQSRSPNYSLIEPVVFDFAPDVAAISIDQPASIAASDAASMTIRDVRAAIAK